MHQRDLAGRSAEGEDADPRPTESASPKAGVSVGSLSVSVPMARTLRSLGGKLHGAALGECLMGRPQKMARMSCMLTRLAAAGNARIDAARVVLVSKDDCGMLCERKEGIAQLVSEQLIQVAVFLAAAAVAAPLGRLLRIGTVLGYLAAGVLIGPFGLGPSTS